MDKKKPTAQKHVPNATKGKVKSSSAADNNTTVTTYAYGCASSDLGYMLFWLDSNIDINDNTCKNTIAKLQSVTSNMHVFNDVIECANFLHTKKNDRVLMVVSGSLGKEILPRIHGMPQLIAVFIFCGDKSKSLPLMQHYPKVQEVSTVIDQICESIKRFLSQQDDDSIDTSLIPANDLSNPDIERIDPSFMYTQLMKEILFELKYTPENLSEFTAYCRENYTERKNVETIERLRAEYGKYADKQSPIWWYTLDTFLYRRLNSALREHEFDVIIKMGFFLTDVHQQIADLHSKQLSQLKEFSKIFQVHRGERAPKEQLEKLKKSRGGLISFNNFLSTSFAESVAQDFVNGTLSNPANFAVIYHITVDPRIPSTPFASIGHISYYGDSEQEVLFSMHTIFRIGDIKQDNNEKRLWHVSLTMTNPNDEQLKNLTERIRMEIEGSTPYYRLGALMIKLGNYQKAEELYKQLLLNTHDEVEKANLFYQLGSISEKQGYFDNAFNYYNDALTLYRKRLPPDHPNIASCYNNIAIVYDNKKDYQEAIAYYEKAVEIYRKLPSNEQTQSHLATAYSSMGLAYNSLRDYKRAAKYCEDALKIFKTCLPANHPTMAIAHNNMGLVYANMKKTSEAAESYKLAIAIGKLALTDKHPDLEQYKKNLSTLQNK